MGPRHTPPEHPSWLFFATCFQIVLFRGLVAFHDLLGLPTYQFVLRTLDGEKEAIHHGISQKSTETCWKQWSAIF
ncbi:unnamed protein product, partial [Callosobruchus maculatus]